MYFKLKYKLLRFFFIRCKHCPLKGAVMPTISEADYGDEEDDDEEMIQ